jgi:flagellar motor protein MotB
MSYRTNVRLLLPLLVCVFNFSCTWQSDLDAASEENRRLHQQIASDAAEKQRLQQQISADRQQLTLSKDEIAAKQRQVDESRRQIADAQVQIQRLAGAIRYTVNSDLLFPPSSWDLSPDGQQIIAKMATQLAVEQRLKLVVNGFTDNAPIAGELRRKGIASNQELSQKRAESVMEFMISQGVSRDLVTAQGFGEDGAIAPNGTAQGRALNRRIEITVAGS